MRTISSMTADAPPTGPTRRQLLQAALPLLGLASLSVRSQPQPIPIADMHSHYGMVRRSMTGAGLADDMRRQRVALVAWKLIADGPWIRSGPTGISQVAEPSPGSLAARFETQLGRMKAHATSNGLKLVLTPADVDACIAGEPGIVLACEGADFLEGHVDRLAAAHQQGLRHLQLVHYIRTPVGDFQTASPVHQGLSAMGRQLVEACNDQRILVDLAHCTGEAVDQALTIAKAPVIWSHGWVGGAGGQWQDTYGYQRRRLSLEHARNIAARGGVVGVWALGLTRPAPAGSGDWSVGRGDTRGYAREVAALVDQLGADHVGLGTDIEGLGPGWAVDDYSGLRDVVDHLQALKLPASTIERVAFGNYVRVLKAAL